LGHSAVVCRAGSRHARFRVIGRRRSLDVGGVSSEESSADLARDADVLRCIDLAGPKARAICYIDRGLTLDAVR